jgi:hypothetical protein
MLPLKAYLAVAALIALSAFALGQLLPGSGAVFAILCTTLWAAYSVRRRRGLGRLAR